MKLTKQQKKECQSFVDRFGGSEKSYKKVPNKDEIQVFIMDVCIGTYTLDEIKEEYNN